MLDAGCFWGRLFPGWHVACDRAGGGGGDGWVFAQRAGLRRGDRRPLSNGGFESRPPSPPIKKPALRGCYVERPARSQVRERRDEWQLAKATCHPFGACFARSAPLSRLVERRIRIKTSLSANKKPPRCGGSLLAEREGFEPSLRYERKHDFESCAFNHSATSPNLLTHAHLSGISGAPRAAVVRLIRPFGLTLRAVPALR